MQQFIRERGRGLRLSLNIRNLQNIPAGSTFGELIKSCFVAPKGWIFGGADFNSLEDMISALTTKDPNKISVYTNGYDGHCLRAYYYFREQMPDIVQATKEERCFQINVGDKKIFCKSGDFIVTSSGQRMPVEDFYEASRH